jgi:hypothetical protein
MGQLINAQINKSKLKDLVHYTNKTTGDESVNITISVNDTPDKYGNNASIWISQTKEERDAKSNKTYIGNGKVVYDSSLPKQNVNFPLSDLPF